MLAYSLFVRPSVGCVDYHSFAEQLPFTRPPDAIVISVAWSFERTNGTTGNWVAIVFMATICGIFLASKVPLHDHSKSANSSRLRWVGCVLAALAISMSL